MPIVMMNREVAEHVQAGARGQQLTPADFQTAKYDKEYDRDWDRVEDVKEVLQSSSKYSVPQISDSATPSAF